MRRIIIKGVKQIRSNSPRFKKFLIPSILLNFRRNFTKCVIKWAVSIFSKNPIEIFSIQSSGPCWYKNFVRAVSRRLRGHQNVERFFKCTKNISYRYLQEKYARKFFPVGFQITMVKFLLRFIKPFSQGPFYFEPMPGCRNEFRILKDTPTIIFLAGIRSEVKMC